ncbi:murein hydrolase activator EnvC family protein [Flaviaesturariibacter amylovorans]|uniref:Murein hydrolase activator EnvC n=1 Tax=Flaviaesturariibacter amylovorans TaxID=1084520 RepID=A0ABP8G7E2_9BACT
MKKHFLFLFSLLLSLGVWAQGQPGSERARMESERKAIQKELRELQEEYNRVHKNKKATLGQLAALQDEMRTRERLLGNINKEIRILSDDIYTSTLDLNRLQRQLDTMKRQYAHSVVYAYKNRSSYDYLNFIFSSSSFNDALKRVRYLRSYRSYRQQQVNTIRETQAAIEDHKQALLAKRSQKNQALASQTEQFNELEVKKKQKDEVAAKLKSQESALSKQLASKKKRDNQLKSQIAIAIRRDIEAAQAAERKRLAEVRRREEEARKAAAANKPAAGSSGTTAPPVASKPAAKPRNSDYVPLNEGELRLANSFASSRGSLPWPVDNGRVSIPYGPSKVGGLSFDNPGVTIETPTPGAAVKAVFEGVVSTVSNTEDVITVLVRHGEFYTVYSNLASASVNKGDNVRVGQSIGTAARADDGDGGQVDFMLMKGNTRQNPSSWLRRR